MPKFFKFFTRHFYKQRNKQKVLRCSSGSILWQLHLLSAHLHPLPVAQQSERPVIIAQKDRGAEWESFSPDSICRTCHNDRSVKFCTFTPPSSPKTQNNINYDIPESHVSDLAGDSVWATLVFTFWAPPSCKKKYTHSHKLYVVQAGLHFGGGKHLWQLLTNVVAAGPPRCPTLTACAWALLLGQSRLDWVEGREAQSHPGCSFLYIVENWADFFFFYWICELGP